MGFGDPMFVPTAVFLDTQVFDRLNYNFNAELLKSFVNLSKERGLTLLLPAPTRDEIGRHMMERATTASAALDKAAQDVHRKAPFLSDWQRFPKVPIEKEKGSHLLALCRNAWKSFTTQLNVAPLGYQGVDLKDIMRWYKHQEAPFGPNGKQKEFPDAIAIAILSAYGRADQCPT